MSKRAVGNQLSPLLNAWSILGTAVDDLLISSSAMPKNTNTRGKALLFVLAFGGMVWGAIHFHFGYIKFAVCCFPIGIVLTLLYAENELKKD